jgi:hypothetical protein
MEIGTGAGPAVFIVAGVAVLLTLMLTGPFLLVATIVVLTVVLTVVATLLVALLIATPYLLARSVYRWIAAWNHSRHRAVGSEHSTDHPAIAQHALAALARPTTARGAQ